MQDDHGDPLTEDRIDTLARQLSQSVIEPHAHDQGLPVETVPTAAAVVEELSELIAELHYRTSRKSPP